MTKLGMGVNRRQFWLLVVINAFVGAMVGLERTVVPLLAEQEFGVATVRAIVAFVAIFGAAKALTNIIAGHLADRFGRKPILVAGWLFAIPIPFILIWAPTWGWIIAANLLLGINQGLSWSATLIMKIDLVGPRSRGLAMGLNEFAGYLAVAIFAFATGYIAERYGLRPEPFYLGIGVVAIGLGLSLFWVKDTTLHVAVEAATISSDAVEPFDSRIATVFAQGTWRDPALSSASQTGLINNMVDGMAWIVFPLLFFEAGLPVTEVAVLVALYPAVWGVLQMLTGAWSDRVGRKPFIWGGMVLQSTALLIVARMDHFGWWVVGTTLLGVGTAMVYPTLLASIGDVAHPSWRGSAVGVYRFWRDLGYVVGAILVGTIADRAGISATITSAAVLALISGLLVLYRMPETRPITGR